MDPQSPQLSLKPLVVAIAAAASIATGAVLADDKWDRTPFRWISTFDVMQGNGSGVAEIIDIAAHRPLLVYTDASNNEIGFVNIQRPARPAADGTVALDGEPTSLAIREPWVLVALNTSESFSNPSGKLAVVNLQTREVVAQYDLGGQPDSIALAPDRKRGAIVIENERDEDLNDGLLPQAPSGGVLIIDLRGPVGSWTLTPVDLSAVAVDAFEGSDLEPEYVDINKDNEAVITFQENNHIAVVDIVTGRLLSQFSAGSVTLDNVDTAEDDLINLDSTIEKRREPDSVSWIDEDHFATANEGDYEDANGEEGGSRGFTVFHQDGSVVYESGESFEHWIVSIGQYNEGRSENKGVEPESVDSGRYYSRELLFVGSERSNAVGVYDVVDGVPIPLQILPTGIGPEGIKAIPARKLLVVSTENDEADVGIPTMINIYETRRNGPSYPMIMSGDDENGLPIPWAALSGLAGDPVDGNTIYGVSDSFLAEGFVYAIDVSDKPAKIVNRLQVNGASSDLDLEGIAVGPDGNFWLGSEGNTGSRENLVLKVNPLTGDVIDEIALPADLVDMRRGNGIEGIAVSGSIGAEIIYVAIQRAWPDEGDIDEVNTKIGRYNVSTGEWSFVHYPLEAEGDGDWVGLSELTLGPDGSFLVIERDKGWGPTTGFNAELKSVYSVELASAEFRSFDDPDGLVTIDKTLYQDLLPVIAANSIWTAEKLEGLAITADGRLFIVTDNDGVDGAPGETVFLEISGME